MRTQIRDDYAQLIYARAKREGKTFQIMLDELLGKVLWNEPGMLFKGKQYKVENNLFTDNEPKPGDFEEEPS